MKLKLISLQDVLRVAATILHPPIRTSRPDGEAKNTLIGEVFKLVGRGTEGGDAPESFKQRPNSLLRRIGVSKLPKLLNTN